MNLNNSMEHIIQRQHSLWRSHERVSIHFITLGSSLELSSTTHNYFAQLCVFVVYMTSFWSYVRLSCQSKSQRFEVGGSVLVIRLRIL